MRCPGCGHNETKVVDSRILRDGEAIRRRRECEKCGNRFTTYERHEEMALMVVKKDGSREEFDREKIRHGIMLACKKRPVPTETMDAVVDQVAQKMQNGGEREVPTDTVGEAVAEELKAIDDVAFVRFLSVYRRFEDTGEFRRALDQLVGDQEDRS